MPQPSLYRIPALFHDHPHAQQVTLGISFLLGAVHALEPGHGKTAMFVWMLQGRRSPWHPIALGLSSAAAHSVSLFLIAGLVHFAHHSFAAEQSEEHRISLLLQWASSLLVIAVGLNMLRQALKRRPTCCANHNHDHHHEVHTQPSTDAGNRCRPLESHHSAPVQIVPLGIPNSSSVPITTARDNLRTTTLLGVAVGLMPCPTALAACFTGLSERSPWSTLLTVGLFALGIAVSLSLSGLVLQYFGHVVGKRLASATHLPWAFIRASLILLTGIFCIWKLI
ncbi:MAG: sulfite exporter TauE/SafE family protein [Planctomycetaceae bacterium]